jgi:hypothetical protein
MTEASGLSSPLNGLTLITDSYERKTRLYPALLVLMPVAVVAACGLGANISVLKAVCGIVVTFGGLLLMAQVARDAGERKEPLLFNAWGGMPSAAMLRHSDERLDSITKERYHKRMASLVKEATAPSVDEEKADPAAADTVYRAWSHYIRTHTRDTKKYRLLFIENINYGYRRNVWGMKSIGIAGAGLSLIGAAAWLYRTFRATGHIQLDLALASAIAAILLLMWTFQFTMDWILIAANAYAERLIESIDTLPLKPSTKST